MCEVKAKTRRCNVPAWIAEQWKDLDKRESLRLCLLETIKEVGTHSDAATRKRIKVRGSGTVLNANLRRDCCGSISMCL